MANQLGAIADLACGEPGLVTATQVEASHNILACLLLVVDRQKVKRCTNVCSQSGAYIRVGSSEAPIPFVGGVRHDGRRGEEARYRADGQKV